MGIGIQMQSNAQLLEIVRALAFRRPLREPPGSAGKQQRDQDADDRNHDQQLDERKTV